MTADLVARLESNADSWPTVYESDRPNIALLREAASALRSSGEAVGYATQDGGVIWYADGSGSVSRKPAPGTILYTTPPTPSAPVGVEERVRGIIALLRQPEPDNGEKYTEFDEGYDQASSEIATMLEAALQHSAAPSVSPAVEGGLPTLAERLERVVEAMRKDDEAVVWWITEVADVAAMIRRLATAEQPGSAVQGEAVGFLLDGRDSTGEPWEALPGMHPMHELHHYECRPQTFRVRAFLYATTPPPAPAAEQAQPEARGVERFVATIRSLARDWKVREPGDDDARHMRSLGFAAMLDSALENFDRATPNPVRAEQPEGKWKLVPVVPTGEMVQAAHEESHCGNGSDHIREVYAAMLAAAPASPGAAVGVDEDGR